AFNTALVVGKDSASGLGKVGVNTAVYFNPDKNIDGALRVKDISIHFYNTGAVLFGVKEYVPALMQYVEKYGSELHFNHQLV
ncbi:hypothetical protein, partial [Acinetobacter nosocomialis]|uniref:hypothetical protein n=1 Tax=Acinetobacter nosocomialis TaxID=106654 RepID=UPI00124E55B5